MALNNRVKYVGQQLVDLTKLRSIEQFVANDFDALVGDSLAGGVSRVVSGLDCLDPAETNPLNLEFNQNVVAYLSGMTGSPAPAGVAQYTAVDPLKFSGTTFPNGTYKVYAVFGMVEGAASNSRFIDPTTKEEFVASVPQNYELSVSLVCQLNSGTPPANSIDIAQFVISGGVISGSVADIRPLMFVDSAGNSYSSLKDWMDSYATDIYTDTLVVGNPTPGTNDYEYQIGYPVYARAKVTASFTSTSVVSTTTLDSGAYLLNNANISSPNQITVPKGRYEISLTGVLQKSSITGNPAYCDFFVWDDTNSVSLDSFRVLSLAGADLTTQTYYPVSLTTIVNLATSTNILLRSNVPVFGTNIVWAATSGNNGTPLHLVIRKVGEAP